MSGASESLVRADVSEALLAAAPFELADLSGPLGGAAPPETASRDVVVRIELGSTSLDAKEAARLADGSVVQLDEAAREPVNIYAGGRLIARGEVLVMDARLCVRIIEVAEL